MPTVIRTFSPSTIATSLSLARDVLLLDFRISSNFTICRARLSGRTHHPRRARKRLKQPPTGYTEVIGTGPSSSLTTPPQSLLPCRCCSILLCFLCVRQRPKIPSGSRLFTGSLRDSSPIRFSLLSTQNPMTKIAAVLLVDVSSAIYKLYPLCSVNLSVAKFTDLNINIHRFTWANIHFTRMTEICCTHLSALARRQLIL